MAMDYCHGRDSLHNNHPTNRIRSNDMALGIKKGSNNSPPQLPPTPQLPPIQRREDPLSSRGAAIADEIANLERDLKNAQNYATDMENRTKVAERLTEDLRAELNHVRNDRDFYHDRYQSVKAKFAAVKLIIADVMKEDDDEKKPIPPQLPMTELTDEDKKRLAFLTDRIVPEMKIEEPAPPAPTEGAH